MEKLFESFLIVISKFSSATTRAVIPVISIVTVIAIISVVPTARLKFRIALVAEIVEVSSFVVVAFVCSRRSHERRVGEGKLAIGDARQFALNGVVVHLFLVPVGVGQFHIVGHCICESLFLFRVFFFQRLIDHYFKILTQMRKFRITLGVRKRFRL